MNTKGLNTHRLQDNLRERIAAKKWADEGPNILPYLLGNGTDKKDPTEGEAVVAATLMQWFGSPVGQHYVRSLVTAFDKARP